MEQKCQGVTQNEARMTGWLAMLHPGGGEDFQPETTAVPCLLQRMPCRAAHRLCQMEQGAERRKGKAEGRKSTQKSTAEVTGA